MNDLYGEIDELVQEELEAVLDEKRKKKKKKKKKSGKKDACYHKVKSRYKVWPSAYASGALVKCRKVGAKNWGNSKKEHVRSIIEDELTKILQEAPSFSYRDYYNNPGVGHSGMFNEPEPDEYKKIKAKISEIIDDMKEELSFLSGAESALEEMKRKMLDPEQFDFNLAMGTDTYGPDSKPRAVYEERPKFGQFYIEFRDAVTQELRDKLKSGEITKNQLFEIVYFADYRMKKGEYNYPSIARLKWIYKNLIQRDKYNRDKNRISIDTLPDREAISNERYLEEKELDEGFIDSIMSKFRSEPEVEIEPEEEEEEEKPKRKPFDSDHPDHPDHPDNIRARQRARQSKKDSDAYYGRTVSDIYGKNYSNRRPKSRFYQYTTEGALSESLEDLVYYTLFEVLEEKKRKKKRKLTAKPSSETSLRDWFGRKGAKGKKGGWVDCNTCRKDKKTGRKKCSACGRSGGEKRSKYPSCRPTPGACGKRGNWGKKSKKGKKG